MATSDYFLYGVNRSERHGPPIFLSKRAVVPFVHEFFSHTNEERKPFFILISPQKLYILANRRESKN